MIEMIKDKIDKYNLLTPGDKVVVAVSGGPDSVVLLHVLMALKEDYDLTLTVCHLNHQLRGEDANEDARFVKQLADDYGLEAFVFSQDVALFSKENKMSFEEGAREVRYRLFEKVMKRTGSNKLAVGQNRNDQAETFLIRLFRGAGLEGLTGIKFKRDHVIRPLLGVSRQWIEEYIEDNQITYRVDSTNDETIYTRNKIRHDLLPYLQEAFNDKVIDQIYTATLLLQDDLDYIEGEVDKVFHQFRMQGDYYRVDLKRLRALHPSMLSRLLRKMIFRMMETIKGVGYQHIQAIMALIEEGKHGKTYRLKEKLCFEINYDFLWVYPIRQDKGLEKREFLLNETFSWQGQTLSVSDLPYSTRDKMSITIDADKIKGKLYVRTRLPGDRFFPLGMQGSKKLSDFMIDLKIPSFKRDEVLLLCDDEEIIWVVGHRMNDHYKIGTDTLIRLTIVHNE